MLTDNDLKLGLTLDPDVKKMTEEIKKIGQEIKDISKQAGTLFDSPSSKNAMQARLDVMKDISEEMKRQREELDRINANMDPSVLKERVAMEEKIFKAREKLGKKEEEERAKQNIEGAKSTIKEFYKSFKAGGLSGLFENVLQKAGGGKGLLNLLTGKGGNTSQLAGSVMGGFAGGGIKGAGGALLGGLAGMGGPIGLAVAALPVVVKVLSAVTQATGKLAAVPFQAVGAGLNATAGAFRDLQGELGPIGAALGLLEGAGQAIVGFIQKIPLIGNLLGPAGEAIVGFIAPIKDILGSLVQMAGKASPVAFKLWQIALEDVQGVIGRTFVPMLTMMRESVRLFGDALATLLPNTREMTAAMAPLREAWRELQRELRSAAGDLGPVLRSGLIMSIQILSSMLGVMVRMLTMAARATSIFLSPLTLLARTMGLASEDTGMRSSVGAAARPAQITGVEEYQRQLQLSAFSQAGGGESLEQQSVNWLERIYNIFSGWTLQGIASSIWSALSAGWNSLTLPGLPTVEGIASAFSVAWSSSGIPDVLSFISGSLSSLVNIFTGWSLAGITSAILTGIQQALGLGGGGGGGIGGAVGGLIGGPTGAAIGGLLGGGGGSAGGAGGAGGGAGGGGVGSVGGGVGAFVGGPLGGLIQGGSQYLGGLLGGGGSQIQPTNINNNFAPPADSLSKGGGGDGDEVVVQPNNEDPYGVRRALLGF